MISLRLVFKSFASSSIVMPELLRMSERSFRYYVKKWGARREEEQVYDEPAGAPLEEP